MLSSDKRIEIKNDLRDRLSHVLADKVSIKKFYGLSESSWHKVPNKVIRVRDVDLEPFGENVSSIADPSENEGVATKAKLVKFGDTYLFKGPITCDVAESYNEKFLDIILWMYEAVVDGDIQTMFITMKQATAEKENVVSRNVLSYSTPITSGTLKPFKL